MTDPRFIIKGQFSYLFHRLNTHHIVVTCFYISNYRRETTILDFLSYQVNALFLQYIENLIKITFLPENLFSVYKIHNVPYRDMPLQMETRRKLYSCELGERSINVYLWLPSC